jgi:hypothetical protein
MFGLFHSDHMIRGRQIGLREPQRKALVSIVVDPPFLQTVEGMARDGTVVAAVECEAARVGNPLQSALLGLPVEEYLGESATIIVTGAEEEDTFWLDGALVCMSCGGGLRSAVASINCVGDYIATDGRKTSR